ncbi:MAG: YitT family protein [Lewinellaceae bacterium]|nr:YitT family protein [Saprospiraceae bacterium]MCB9306954.1 YitT family protein [Lewinellaceae bacterium]MCB9354262.1 YitT family protein [Lewinellaceae bacterium]
MHKFLYKLLVRSVTRRLGEASTIIITPYRLAKAFVQLKADVVFWLRSALLVALGIVSAGFGLKGFLLPNHFIDGGVTGISLIVNHVTNVPLSVLLVFINLPFIMLGFTQIGRSFAVKSILAITGLALAVALIQYPVVTSDKLLVATFGGFFLGAGIGLAVRGGAVIDGTEVLAIFVGKKTGLTIGDVILLFNVMIFLTAAYVLSVEAALYSMLTYISASKTVDFIVEGIEEYIGVTIISVHHDEIRQMIVEKVRRGVTVYKGKKGYGKSGEKADQSDILFTVVTRLEIAKLRSEVEKIDPNAFVFMTNVLDAKGGMIKKRPLKE